MEWPVPPAPELVRRSPEAAVVVVGHRRAGGFPRLPPGPVALRVTAHAGCPVLVVRPGEGTGSGAAGRRVVMTARWSAAARRPAPRPPARPLAAGRRDRRWSRAARGG
nr:universal stress protein [Streptomyces sp. PCS3-D2]